jgi:DNA-binding transcriptional ArsR family regulator
MPKSHASAARLREVLRLFALFGLPIRVVIVQRLARVPSTAGELERELPISRAGIVQHLKLLEAAGVVEASREGRRRVYRVRGAGFAPLARWIERHSRTGR